MLKNELSNISTSYPPLQSFFKGSSQEAFTIFFSLHPLPMWMYDSKTLRITEVNEAAINYYGYSKAEFELLHLSDIVEEKPDTVHVQAQVSSSPRLLVHRRKNGDTFYAEVTSTSIRANDREYIIEVIIDRTEQINAEQDLSERKAHEIMLEKLNNSLEKRATELANSNEELEKFAYVASHDLQEPLRMVSSFLQLLEKRYKEKLDQKAHEYISYAVDGAERMKKLILDLLEYSRVNSSESVIEDVDVNKIVNELKLTYKTRLKETGGTINADTLPTIKASKIQMLQLFQNLLSNAFKYKSDKPPVINITAKENEHSHTFSINDNGIGIDAKFYNKIFIIFQRLHNREQYSGTGIGLAICKKIIDKHGGKIWVTSTPDEGSTFYFSLPKH